MHCFSYVPVPDGLEVYVVTGRVYSSCRIPSATWSLQIGSGSLQKQEEKDWEKPKFCSKV